MSHDLEITQGDIGVAFTVELYNPDGTAVSFDANDTAQLRMRQKGVANPTTLAYTMTPTVNSNVVSYTFISGQTDTPGRYEAEVEVTFNASYVLTWPHPRFPRFSFLIKEAL